MARAFISRRGAERHNHLADLPARWLPIWVLFREAVEVANKLVVLNHSKEPEKVLVREKLRRTAWTCLKSVLYLHCWTHLQLLEMKILSSVLLIKGNQGRGTKLCFQNITMGKTASYNKNCSIRNLFCSLRLTLLKKIKMGVQLHTWICQVEVRKEDRTVLEGANIPVAKRAPKCGAFAMLILWFSNIDGEKRQALKNRRKSLTSKGGFSFSSDYKEAQGDLTSNAEVWYSVVQVNDFILSHFHNIPPLFSSDIWHISYKRAYELPTGSP